VILFRITTFYIPPLICFHTLYPSKKKLSAFSTNIPLLKRSAQSLRKYALPVNASSALTSNTVLALTMPSSNTPVLLLRMLRESWLSTQTRQDSLISRREIIKDLEFFKTEPTRHDKNAERDQEDD
jgi:hypothetical protein